jgi:hypothetical protein
MFWLILTGIIVLIIALFAYLLFRTSFIVDVELFRRFNELAHHKKHVIIMQRRRECLPLRVEAEYMTECPDASVVYRVRNQGTLETWMECSRGTLGLFALPDGRVTYSYREDGLRREVPANLRELVHDTFKQLKSKVDRFEHTKTSTTS